MREVWRPYLLSGGGSVEVSNHGRIRNPATGHIYLPGLNSEGYLRVCIRCKGHTYNTTVAQIVARVWVPNPQRCRYVTYLDHNPLNLSADNLMWTSSTGLHLNSPKGVGNYTLPQSVICEETKDVFPSQKAAAAVLGVAASTISHAINTHSAIRKQRLSTKPVHLKIYDPKY